MYPVLFGCMSKVHGVTRPYCSSQAVFHGGPRHRDADFARRERRLNDNAGVLTSAPSRKPSGVLLWTQLHAACEHKLKQNTSNWPRFRAWHCWLVRKNKKQQTDIKSITYFNHSHTLRGVLCVKTNGSVTVSRQRCVGVCILVRLFHTKLCSSPCPLLHVHFALAENTPHSS